MTSLSISVTISSKIHIIRGLTVMLNRNLQKIFKFELFEKLE